MNKFPDFRIWKLRAYDCTHAGQMQGHGAVDVGEHEGQSGMYETTDNLHGNRKQLPYRHLGFYGF